MITKPRFLLLQVNSRAIQYCLPPAAAALCSEKIKAYWLPQLHCKNKRAKDINIVEGNSDPAFHLLLSKKSTSHSDVQRSKMQFNHRLRRFAKKCYKLMVKFASTNFWSWTPEFALLQLFHSVQDNWALTIMNCLLEPKSGMVFSFIFWKERCSLMKEARKKKKRKNPVGCLHFFPQWKGWMHNLIVFFDIRLRRAGESGFWQEAGQKDKFHSPEHWNNRCK